MKTVNKKFKVPYVYLHEQFSDIEKYLKGIRKVVDTGDFTLGKRVLEFEERFAKKLGVKHVIGVGNGTDALFLALLTLGIGKGDEVITAPNSFIASASVIALVGATPVFVDVRDDYTIDPDLLEKAITPKTKAIIPVHLIGNLADMHPIMKIAKKHNLRVVEDVAQAALAKYDGKCAGSFGEFGCFSFHPLKILNVWGDGGAISTNSDVLAKKIRLWRNHGLVDRDHVEFFAHNSRLDTIQAVIVDTELLGHDKLLERRKKVSHWYDERLSDLSEYIHIPSRKLCVRPTSPTYTNYVVQVKRRDELYNFLMKNGVEVKVHYPTPIHLQNAAKYLGYKKGDFPVTEKQASTIITLPCNQYLKQGQVDYVCKKIREFYTSSSR